MISKRQAGRATIGLGLALATLAGAAGVAQAATDLGTIDKTSHFNTKSASTTPTFDYTFTLAAPTGKDVINLSASPVKGAQAYSALTLNLYKVVGTTDTLVGSTSTIKLLGAKTVTESLVLSSLTAGKYLIDIVAVGKANASLAGTVSVSPVPLPAALPLFGAALMGLGGIGWRRARRGPSAA